MSTNSRISVGLLLASLVAWSASDLASAQAPPAPRPQNMLPDPEVLDQGPIHEAFAEPLALERQELEIITKRPPEPIQELPPEQRPEGQNVQWIPGYFMFDRDRNDFVWVSGLWREVPPGRNWVPGEWQEVDGGWEWVHGFWSDAEQELRLLPFPPASLEAGPSSPAPGDNYLWAPGCWNWQNTGYAWQAGFWYQAQPNWVWVPNHFSYTPRGCLFVRGYWDYPPLARGWLYAPVYWGGGIAGYRGNYFYRPHNIINVNLLFNNLFVDHSRGRYYYGYQGRVVPHGLQPWGANYGKWGGYGNQGRGHHGGYDPLWAYNKKHHGLKYGVAHNGPARGNVANNKLVTSADDFIRSYRNSGGKNSRVHQLTESEVSQVRTAAKKYANFDRTRIGLDDATKAQIKNHQGVTPKGKLADRAGTQDFQGRVLRQNQGTPAQGKILRQGNADLSDRGPAVDAFRKRGSGSADSQVGAINPAEINARKKTPTTRSQIPLDTRTRVPSGGDNLSGNAAKQFRGTVNQWNQGNRLNEGSAPLGRQNLYYRGSGTEGTKSGNKQNYLNQQPQTLQRWQQSVPNSPSLQKQIPRINNSPSPSFRSGSNHSSLNRIYQGSGQGVTGRQGAQKVIQSPQRSFSPPARSSFSGGGGSSGMKQAPGGNQGGGAKQGGGGQRRGR